MKILYLLQLALITSCTLSNSIRVENGSSKKVIALDLPLKSGKAKRLELEPGESGSYRTCISRTYGFSLPLIELYRRESTTRNYLILRNPQTPEGLTYELPEPFRQSQERWKNINWLSQVFTKNQAKLSIYDIDSAEFHFNGMKYEIRGKVN